MTEGLRPGDPPGLGPFVLRGRLAEHDAGVVFVGHDPTGRPVALTVLHAAAAADPAVRDRLTGALDALAARHPGQVLAASPQGAVPWVATAYVTGRPDHALDLLDAAGLVRTGSGAFASQGATAGPDFAPHWADSPDARIVTPRPVPPLAGAGVPAAASRRSLGILAACVVAALAAVVAGGFVARAVLGGEDQAAPTSERTPGLAGPETETDPGPGEPRPDDPEAGPSATAPPWVPTPEPSGRGTDGPEGLVAGPTYGKDQPTYLMDLDGFPFSFRVPRSWGCLRSDKAGPGVVRWVCVDDSYAFSGKPGDPPRGIIEVQQCPSRCGAAQWTRIRDRLPAVQANWRRTDETTIYAEWVVGAGESARASVAMSHVFASRRGGAVDSHVAVRLAGPSAEKKTLQKIINEVRVQTP